MNFADLRLAEPILRSLKHEGYENPTPIQAQAIPDVLAGRDLLGCAQTGTGKTAAFALPILHRLINGNHTPHAHAPHGHVHEQKPTNHKPSNHRNVRCLVLAPTRELALQIDESFRTYGRHLHLKHAVVFGGVSQHGQASAISRGVDILVATPGRLLDLMNQGIVSLNHVEIFVLDEADRMLDMGFINDIRKIVAQLPRHRQNLMFSATMPQDIRALADTILNRPALIQVAPQSTPVETIDQSVYFVERRDKPALLAHLIKNTGISRALVFTRTKHGADRVVRQLYKSGIRAEAIHGNKTQNARQRALTNFKSGKTPILIASDIAARGIDVDDISHVFNYDLTHEPETYVHRIGRTARAGASGHAISFCDTEERPNLHAIERLIKRKIRVNDDAPEFPEHKHEPHRNNGEHVHSRTSHQPHRHSQPQQRQHQEQRAQQPRAQRDGHRSATPQAANSRSHAQSQAHSHSRANGQHRSRSHSNASPNANSNANSNAHSNTRSQSSHHPRRAKHPLDRRGQHGPQRGHRKHHAKHR